MTHRLGAERCAELLTVGLVRWSGPRCDVVLEPIAGAKFLARRGTGNVVEAFERAEELRRRIREAVARALTEFAAST